MIKQDYKKLGVFAGFVIIIAMLCFVLFKNCTPRNNSDTQELMNQKDSIIAIYKEKNNELYQVIEQLRDEQGERDNTDSLLSKQLKNYEQFYKSINEKLKNIPVSIRRNYGNDDSISAELSRFRKEHQ